MALKGNLIYGQSGGPTGVINSSAYGVISEAFKHPEAIQKVYASLYGIDGILSDNLREIEKEADKTNLELLKQTPGAAFGSTRHKLPLYKDDPTEYQKVLEIFQKYNIRYFLYNGGNDSMDTLTKLSAFFKNSNYECYLVGVPKTIDNDLVDTDHCPGYGSAAKYIANSFAGIVKDASSYLKGRINVVEIMGRDTGWLTAAASLAGLSDCAPDLIYVPEIPFSVNDFLADSKAVLAKKGHAFVAVSEGIRDNQGAFVADNGTVDAFGHPQLGGAASYLCSLLTQEGIKNRAIELSLAQRSASYILSKADQEEAVRAGQEAVLAALRGIDGEMLCFLRDKLDFYSLLYKTFPLKEIGGQIKYLPRTMMNGKGNNVSSEFITYALPLIQGEVSPSYNNGVLAFADFLHN